MHETTYPFLFVFHRGLFDELPDELVVGRSSFGRFVGAGNSNNDSFARPEFLSLISLNGVK